MKLLHANLTRILHSVMLTMTVGLAGIAHAGDLRIAGTGNALGTMKLLAQAYNKSHKHTHVVVLDSLGSTGAIRAITKSAIDIGLSSKPLSDQEKRQGLHSIEYARSPTVFAVNPRNKTTSITTQQIIDLYNGKLTHWPDGTLIRPVLRQPGEDNIKQIQALDPAMPAALEAAERRLGMSFAVTDQKNADKLENIPGSIGVTTLALIRSEKRQLHPLTLNGVKPTPENAQAGRYPMIKHFYFILSGTASPEAVAFIQFAHSAQGRAILKRTGHTIP